MTNSKKTYVASMVLGFLIVVLIIFLIYPVFKEIKNDSKEFVSQKENLAVLEAKVKNIKEFEAVYRNLKPNLEKINTLFVNQEVPVEFIGFLEKTSKGCGLTFSLSLSPQIKVAEDVWPSLNFQINLEGNFLDFSKFLEKLESSPYLIEIQNITINKLGEFSSNNVKAALSIKVYAK